tara:strand:+ start:344 stop:532 length:189 start_codon:yes stop_codon:yes gene_type:complete
MIYNFLRNIYSRLITIFQLYKFIVVNKDYLKMLLLTALVITSIFFIIFKLFEFLAPFTYLAL